MDEDREPIGSRLVAEGLIEPEQLAWALRQQSVHGGYLGRHLVDAGFLSSSALDDALARAWGMKLRDLVAQPPHEAMLAALDVEDVVDRGWLACEVTDDGVVVVASCRPPDGVMAEEVVNRFPGMAVEFVACGQEDLDSVVLGVRRGRPGQEREHEVYLVRPVHAVLTAVGGIAWLVAAVLMPGDLLSMVLLGAGAVFLVTALTQWGVDYPADRTGARRSRPAGTLSDPGGDASLPLYSVILRVGGGERGLAELFDNFRDVDYPRERTDAILLVADDDHDTLAALRATEPRGWARVAKIPARDFVDVIQACDHGLALARGRYVVAYDQDERPAPDQLRRAAAVFQADLDARLEGRSRAEPLVGLRVSARTGPQWPTPFDRLTAVDEVVPVEGAWSDRPGPVRSADVTSIHFSSGLLRRLGGFGLLVDGAQPVRRTARPPRIESLDSRSTRGTDPTMGEWLRRRAESLAPVILEAARRLGAPGRARPAGADDEAVAGRRVGGASMFLTYPVMLVAMVALMVRHETIDDAVDRSAVVAGGVMAGFVLLTAVVMASLRLLRRRGWRSCFGALALPAHWLLHGLAAWLALWVVVVRRPQVSGRGDRRPARPS